MTEPTTPPQGSTTVANVSGDASVESEAASPPVETVTFTLDGR